MVAMPEELQNSVKTFVAQQLKKLTLVILISLYCSTQDNDYIYIITYIEFFLQKKWL